MVYKLFKLLALDLRAVAVPEDEIRVLVFADYPAELVLSDPEIYGGFFYGEGVPLPGRDSDAPLRQIGVVSHAMHLLFI
jgi:hypothetical protein